jgi:uncharacterized membrane protein
MKPRPSWAARLVRGSAVVWVAVTLPLFVSLVGLAIDGGLVFDARRELQSVADGAARAGAMQLDETAYRATAGAEVVLERTRAQAVAWQYLAAQGVPYEGDVSTSSDRIVVTLRTRVATAFLRLAGITDVTIEATAPAEVRHGIERPNR